MSYKKEKYWTRRLDTRLVKYLECRRLIWDPAHPHYTSIDRRKQVYENFAAKYGSHFSADSVKERWVNIRSTFKTVLNKVKASLVNNPEKPYVPTWHLWENCQFLLNRVSEPPSLADRPEQIVKLEPASNYEEDTKMLLMEADLEASYGPEFNEDIIDDPIDDRLSCNDLVNGIFVALNNIPNGPYGVDEKYAKIGRTVSRKLSKMKSYEAAVVSNKIMEILLLYDEQNPENPNIVDEKNAFVIDIVKNSV